MRPQEYLNNLKGNLKEQLKYEKYIHDDILLLF